ncbi:hypothetical protein GCM10027268_18870 [Brachybacterium huguangmaarense]
MGGYRIDRQLAEFGEHVRGWRMVLGLTAQQVSERAGITRDTLRKIEAGDPSAGFGNVAHPGAARPRRPRPGRRGCRPARQRYRPPACGEPREEARTMTTVDVVIDGVDGARMVGQAHVTR